MDHSEIKKRKPDPRKTANLVSKLTFFFTLPLFKKAFKFNLKQDDLCQPPDDCKSEKCGKSLFKFWTRRKHESRRPNAFGLIWRHFGAFYILLGVIDVSYHCFYSTVQPEAVSQIISYFSPNTKLTKHDAYYNAGILLLMNIINLFYINNFSLMISQYAMRIRTAFTSLLYRKILKLSPKALDEINLGNIVTIITKDVVSFEHNIFLINDMLLGSLECSYVSFLIYRKMGATAFIGIGLMVVVLPLQAYLAKIIAGLRLKMSKRTDERLHVMQEVISAIKIIKMYAWEACFEKKISDARKNELAILLKTFYLQVTVCSTGMLVSKLSFFASILTYIYLGNPTTADMVYYVLSCFNHLRGLLAIAIPYGWSCGAQMYAALIRISKVLNAEETCGDNTDYKYRYQYKDDITKPGIDIEDVTVKMYDSIILDKVNFKANSGLIVISGPVGCGKSILLKTILKEFPIETGTVRVQGSLSYASQEPWLFPSTIKQNILFGEKYRESRYKEVIRICALEHDFATMDYGDGTIVADRGMNLSKGQQARINLARAIYKDSDIYLLDDPLAALDNSIKNFVFSDCIKGFLSNKLCVLVSQMDDHLREADRCFIIGKDGHLVEDIGVKLIENFHTKTIEEDDDTEWYVECKKESADEIYREDPKHGSVDLKYYTKYVKLGGGFLLMGLVTIFSGGATIVNNLGNKELSHWVDYNQKTINLSDNINSTEYTESQQQTNKALNLYMGLILTSVLLEFLMMATELQFLKRSAFRIHKYMTNCVLNAVMTFFDYTFVGNILNRFSQDLSTVDETLTFIMVDVFRFIIELSSILIIICTINWLFLIPSVLLIISTVTIRFLYIPLSRSLRRLESTTRSPMVGHLNCTLEGLTTIRAFKRETICTTEYDRHQDLFSSARYLGICTSRGFGFFLEAGCTLLLSFIVYRFLFFEADTSAGNVGFALTEVMNLSGTLLYGIRNWTALETHMTSVERLFEYTEIAQESKHGKTVSNWPRSGAVKFQDVSLNYSKNENVLRDITFAVQPRQKIGIVGRTGAGKSSIISVLFRLYNIEGDIFIDNMNIRDINLKCIRRNIAIIPQDPILFNGSMRFNIDPLNEFTDEIIWKALEKVKLKHAIHSLNMELKGKGSIFSSGQKQLICLARALILKCKIVVLDEASANMDAETEKLLDSVIRESFSNCTLFIIAHRLHSIENADKIMVLKNGELVEFDTPSALMKDGNGYFHNIMGQRKHKNS